MKGTVTSPTGAQHCSESSPPSVAPGTGAHCAPPAVSGRAWRDVCEERYRNLIEQAIEGVFVLDPEGRFVDVNPAGARLFGVGREALLGCSFPERAVRGDPVRLGDFQTQLAAGGTMLVRKRFLRQDGSVFHGELSARRLSCGCYQCILRDISDRRKAELVARTALHRLGAVFENSPMGVILVRVLPDGGIRFEAANPAVARMLAVSRTQLEGRNPAEVLPPTVARELDAQLERCLETKQPGEFEVALDAPAAGQLYRVCLFPVGSAFGRIPRIAVFVDNITERRHAEEAVRASEEKFSRIFHVGPEAIGVSEFATGRLLEVNESFLKMFGWSSAAEVCGRTSDKLGIWDRVGGRTGFQGELREKGIVRNLEVSWRRSGELRTGLLSAGRIDLHGRPCILSMISDITEQRRAEGERAAAAEREARAKEHFTRRLLESQEAERTRIARELHDSLGQDLLLLKTRLQMAVEHLSLSPEVRAQVEAVEELAAAAVGEVRRISRALRPYQLEHLGLTNSLRAMLDAVGASAPFRLQVHLDDVDGVFRPEAEMNLYRIVQECLSNIIKHARAANVDVTVEHDVRAVRLIVADDGCGFAPAEASGRGLGLPHIAERARILGGVVRVDSAPGTGTRTEVAVPLPDPV